MLGSGKRVSRPVGLIAVGGLVCAVAVALAGPALGLWHVSRPVSSIEIARGQAGFNVSVPSPGPALSPDGSPTLPATLSFAPVSEPLADLAAVTQRQLDLGPSVAEALVAAAKRAAPAGQGVVVIPFLVQGYSDGNVGLKYTVNLTGVGFDKGSVLGDSVHHVSRVDDAADCLPASPPGPGNPSDLTVNPAVAVKTDPGPPSFHQQWFCLVLRHNQGMYHNDGTVSAGTDGDLHQGTGSWSINIGPDPTTQTTASVLVTPELFRADPPP